MKNRTLDEPYNYNFQIFLAFCALFVAAFHFSKSLYAAATFDVFSIVTVKPSTVKLMQNVDLGHTKVIQIRQRETLSPQGAMIHENCCSAAQCK